MSSCCHCPGYITPIIKKVAMNQSIRKLLPVFELIVWEHIHTMQDIISVSILLLKISSMAILARQKIKRLDRIHHGNSTTPLPNEHKHSIEDGWLYTLDMILRSVDKWVLHFAQAYTFLPSKNTLYFNPMWR